MASRNKEKKRRVCTIKEKLALIEGSTKPGYTQIEAAKRHSIKQSTLAGILKEKSKLLSLSASSQKAKHVSQCEEQELEDLLHAWFLRSRKKGLLLDRPLLRKQAEKMARELQLETNLKFSAGWCSRWRRRYGVQFKKQHGEATEC